MKDKRDLKPTDNSRRDKDKNSWIISCPCVFGFWMLDYQHYAFPWEHLNHERLWKYTFLYLSTHEMIDHKDSKYSIHSSRRNAQIRQLPCRHLKVLDTTIQFI
jgi:hypothetical protein